MEKELNDLLLRHFENPYQRSVVIPSIAVVTSSAFSREEFIKLVSLLGNSFLDYVEKIINYGEKGVTVSIFTQKANELKEYWEEHVNEFFKNENNEIQN